jgi:hypothetical protein
MFEVDDEDNDGYDFELPSQPQSMFSRPERKIVAEEEDDEAEGQAERRGDEDAYDVDIAEDIGAPTNLAVEALPAPEAYPAEREDEDRGPGWSATPMAVPRGHGCSEGSGGRGSDHSAEFGPAFGAADVVRGGAVADDTEQLSLGGEESSVSDYF